MSFRPRFLSALVAIFAFAGATTQLASCGLDPYGTQPPVQVATCSTDANCDDQNPCTVDQCLPDKTCTHSNAPNAPLTQQIAGDCRRDDCIDGEVVPTNDDADIADDNEFCTTDTCSNGNPSHMPLGDGTTCTMGASPGNCVKGVCTVECSPTKPCDDKNPCTEEFCDAAAGTCTYVPLDGLPTPKFNEPVGDCKLHICANGVDTAINDDADVFDDMNSCTQNVCTMGVGSNPGVSLGTPCVVGKPEVCNGQGSCVQCNVPSDCVLLPADDNCQTRTCVNNVCGQSFTAAGTPTTSTPAQIPGDCQRIVCDGAGDTTSENFDTDLPIDNNSCTQNICTNGVPSNPLEAKDFVCGTNQVCNASGNCVGCNDAAQCVGTDDFCKTRTCINQICGYSYTPVGTDLPTGQTSQDCKVIECDGMGTAVQNPDGTDKPVDGNQCTQDLCTMGVPSNPFEMINVACNQTGGTVCNGAGACKKANSATCAAGSDCLSGFCVDGVCCNATCGATCKSCNVPGSIGTCVNVPKAAEDLPGCTGTNSCDGAGTCKKDDAQGCAAATDCVSNFCADGVCCASACTTACRVCNAMGSVGVCTNITAGEDPVATTPCTGMKACDSAGVCKTKDGNTCTVNTDCVSGQCFDGVCCNVACSGTCKSCNIAGAIGICSNVATGQDDANGVPSCSGVNQSCDGMGTCKKEIAEVCGANSECLSGFCVDGVCCNGSCISTCQACNLASTVGTCTNVVNGQDDVGTCSGTNQSCDGAGACKKDIGQVCNTATDCLSNFCVDGYCCNTACSGTCQACSILVQGQGTNGTCGPIVTGNDPDNECMNGSCNGAATCKLDVGVACAMGSQCLSGFCADGVCCNSACGNSDPTDCQACSTGAGAATNGACAALAANTTCRASAGNCDLAETCNGVATACPADVLKSSGTSCRASAGVCDIAETCTGMSAACPADVLSPSGTSCRASAGACDIAETCTGMSAACPADALSPSGTSCRASAGVCDIAETCTGMAATCPTDVLSPSGTSCRAAVGLCDVAETCTGASTTCPADTLKAAGTVCRAAVGTCDVVETCSGASGMCPIDAFVSSGTQCAPPSCMGTSQVNTDTCNGMGTCVDNGTTVCNTGYTCVTTACKTSCTADTDCATGYFCSSNACVPLSGNGIACTAANHCSSGFCVDNVCCNTSCTANCNACTAVLKGQGANGTCGPIIAGNDPQNECMNGACGGGSTCKSDNGQTCVGGTDCLSSNCIDTVCCDSACSGLCQACSAVKKGAGADGTCGSVVSGTDPDDECATDPVSTCNQDGFCDGAAACQLYVTGTVCTPMTCSMGVQSNADTCNGMGTCVDAGTVNCTPFVCGMNACKSSCTLDTDCVTGRYCSGGACVLQKANGVACTGANQCTSSFCTDNVCCDLACNGLCEACTATKKGSGSDGTCGFITTGTDPDNECSMSTPNCDGAGMCQ